VDLLDDARTLADDLTALRRALHAEPETGLALPRTQERVLAELAGLPLEVRTGEQVGSVVAVLRGTGSSETGTATETGTASGTETGTESGAGTGQRPTVLLRADMDALPVAERTGLDFAATNGAMHACGHDLHTTMLIGAARLLSTHRDRLSGDVVLMFQPGEEGHDGARYMIDEGVLEASGRTADAAYALHVTSAIFDSHTVATRPGAFMAASDVLHVQVIGAGGHGSQPHLAQDPTVVAAEIVIALQTLVTRQFDAFDPVVITVGSLHAGIQHNVISERAEIVATVRSFSPEAQRKVAERAVRLCRGIAEAHGLSADVRWQEQYPVTVNDDAQAGFVEWIAGELLGPRRLRPMRAPLAGSEDFSRVLQAVPGAMAFLGATPPGADPATAPFNHSAFADFDEAVLPDGAALLAQLAISRLALPER
jgi:amidohydrolase